MPGLPPPRHIPTLPAEPISIVIANGRCGARAVPAATVESPLWVDLGRSVAVIRMADLGTRKCRPSVSRSAVEGRPAVLSPWQVFSVSTRGRLLCSMVAWSCRSGWISTMVAKCRRNGLSAGDTHALACRGDEPLEGRLPSVASIVVNTGTTLLTDGRRSSGATILAKQRGIPISQ